MPNLSIMAIDAHRDKSIRRKKKLLAGEHVEVLSTDDGLDGSWHSGIVIECLDHIRLVEYDHLLSDATNSKLREPISVSHGVEGRLVGRGRPRKYRGNIRPSPPDCVFSNSDLVYGLCVDALVDDAWWEGVVFDKETDSNQRLIFFPDQGDQHIIDVKNLRITLVWDEYYAYWSKRGEWALLQVIQKLEKEEDLPVSVREIWFDLRSTEEFSSKIGYWTLGPLSAWIKLVSKLVVELNLVVVNDSIILHNLTEFHDKDICSDKDIGLDNSTRMALTTLFEGEKDKVLTDYPTKNALATRSKNLRIRKKGWKSVGLKGAYDPEAIEIYTNKDGAKSSKDIRMKAKKHLIAVGWKIDKRKIESIPRLRFRPPVGKTYFSLSSACCALLQGQGNKIKRKRKHMNSSADELGNQNKQKRKRMNSSIGELGNQNKQKRRRTNSNINKLVPAKSHRKLNRAFKRRNYERKNSKALSSVIDNDIKEELSSNASREVSSREDNDDPDSGNSSNAVLEYKTYIDKIRSNEKPDRLVRLQTIKANARRQLKRVGYKFYIIGKQKSIESPSGKRIRSLYKACGEYSGENTKDINFKKRDKKSKKKKSDSPFTPARKSESANKAHTSTRQAAKTVLSLLIDNDMILPRQKVRCVREFDKYVLVEGQITRDGIKCKCCSTVHPLKDFEAHAGSMDALNTANIILQDGRSLLECQMQMIKSKKPVDTKRSRLKPDCSKYKSDTVCSACHEGGTLLLCDCCPSSFHIACVGLEVVPDGKWFCPSCRCGICGKSEFNCDTENFTEESIMYCDQCELEYHVGCLREGKNVSLSSCPVGNWFCSEKCSQIFVQLRQLIGKSHQTSKEGLTWTILRSTRDNGVDDLQYDVATMTSHDIKLCVALDVLHECFVNIVEPRTRSDFVADLVFNRESELRRLNFYGFYTMLLEKGDELISVASFRVYGNKVAELPLIGTRVNYRHQGMCRLLVNELEKVLSQLGVETLVLPAIPQLLKTWTTSFGFKEMDIAERLQYSEYTTLIFLDTTMCKKSLTSLPVNTMMTEVIDV